MATLPERLQASAAVHPDRPALVSGDHQFSYGQLLSASERLAAALKQRGLQRIGLCGDNAPAWVVADLACLLAGVVCVPVPVFFSAAQTQHLVTTAGLQALLWPDEAPGREPLGEGVWIDRLGDNPARAPLPSETAKVTFTSGSTGTPKGVCLSQAQ